MLLRQIAEPSLAQYAYLVGCPRSGEALLIDPLRDIDRYVAAAAQEGLRITAVAETHLHADFLSGAREFAARFGTALYLSDEGAADGWASAWARGLGGVTFLRDGDTFRIGHLEIRALHTPGHTPEHLSYAVTDLGGGATSPIGVATGDFVFVGDLGRPDLLEQAAGEAGAQEASARALYASLPAFRALADHVQVWPGHGAGSACGKALGAVPTTTVGYEKRYNASLAAADGGEQAFVDAILSGQPEPPTYFARMKRANRDGVPLLGPLPQPPVWTAAAFAARLAAGDALVIDTRPDRSAFMARHVPGALYAPLTKSFGTVVGSLVVDETTPLVLVVDEAQAEAAIRQLVRLGYDTLAGLVAPATQDRYFADGGPSASIPEGSVDDLAAARADPAAAVVDVRFASEYAAGHVPGALHAPYTRLPLGTDRLPTDRTLVVHCLSGARSAVAAAFLAREGFDVVFINGALAEYAARYPVEGDPALA